ncbi:hypothetical protein J4E83_007165 [Alternaria metachromatica]|uniref:uncharacterized protein n=1 Tax=Alternaria metachromatica TaxID=283354 RepID=UPI0020C2451C|nr:uncharacterized protein J4E83_007165 [Alternaria metachromatica]KAI4614511.1 hypothetical protein J4E83_007165 [Alternaria metachromatica]
MSRLEVLPQHILRDILRYLLLSDRVRGPPNRYLVEDYDFQVAVLRTNKAINQEATNIFYEDNKWIKLHNGYGTMIETALINHETPYFKLKMDEFDKHVAEVNVNPSFHQKSRYGGKTTVGLLLLQDMAKFARVLRILDFANFMAYDFKFALHKPPGTVGTLSREDQERLILPMEKVSGVACRQQVAFTTSFDAVLVERVKQAMTQGVAWLRAAVAEVYDIALSIKCMGDMAFNIGNGDMAFAKWDDTLKFIDITLEHNNMMSTRLEPDFLAQLRALECMVCLELAMFFFSDMAIDGIGRKYEHVPKKVGYAEDAKLYNELLEFEAVPVSAIARFYRFLGVAELGLDHPVKAAKAFAKSYKMATLPPTQNGYNTARSWKELTKAQRKSRLDALHTALPKTPHMMPAFQAWKGPQVQSEHWVMRELGFKGDIPYADKITGISGIYLTTKAHPNRSLPGPRTTRLGAVKPKVLMKVVERHREEVNQPTIPGIELLMMWIALGPNDLGEESIHDDPDTAKMLEKMSLRGPGGCPTQ